MDIVNTINRRIIVLMILIFSIAIGLVGKLYSVQIVNSDYYAELVRRKELSPIYSESARGEIYDRKGNKLVENEPFNTITYLSRATLSEKERWELAHKFIKVYEVDDELTKRELKDLYLFTHNYGRDLVTREEEKELSYNIKEIDKLKLSRVTDEHVNSLSKEDRKAFRVMLQMNEQSQGNPAIILEGVSKEDIAYIAEHKNELPGFDWGTTYKRKYIGPDSLKGIVGDVKAIPQEKLSYMVSKGYAVNDNMGVSGLEYMYEDQLVGVKTKYQYDPTTGKNATINKGRKGNDLVLSLDIELQKKIEDYMMNKYRSLKREKGRDLLQGLDFVMTDPETGQILSIIAIREDSKGNLYNSPQSVFLEAYPVGSVVKGATVYMGLEEKVIKPGEVIIDEPLYIQGTQPRVSYRPLGPMTDQTALHKSSNVYMFMVAIRLGGGKYVPNKPLIFSKPIDQTFGLMRNYFSQFGLGVNTMVDYPIELNGYKGSTQSGGHLLEFAVGQYDNYNAMQLNQYMATVANGGNRLQPFLVKEVVNMETEEVVYENTPVILNQLSGPENLERVREGFRGCVTVGTCGARIRNLPYSAAAKTGTAQYVENGVKLVNNAYIAFAPFKNPQVATSCILNGSYREAANAGNECRNITPDVIEIYMKHK